MEFLERKTKFSYSRSLKLGPAIGDWTVLQYKDPALDDIQVSQIQNVNFDSLTKETLRQLHYIHYRLAEKMAQQLCRDTELKVELHTVVASQMTYEEFLSSQHDKVVQADYVIEDFGRVNVIFSWALADMIVNRLTGGLGEESEAEYFSSAEAVVLQAIMDELVEPFTDVWGGAIGHDAVKTSFNTGQFIFDQKVSLREAYVTFTVYLYFGKGDLKHITWAYPSSTIRKLFREKLRLSNGVVPNIQLSNETLKSVTVDVVATLGAAELTMKDLKTLQPGDVIPLDTSFNQFINVKVGSDLYLKGQPGIKKDKLCLQVFLEDAHAALQPLVRKSESNVEASEPVLTPDVSKFTASEHVAFSAPVSQDIQDDVSVDSFVFEPELGDSSHDDLGAAIHNLDDNEDAFTDFDENFEEPSTEFNSGTRLESNTPDQLLEDDNLDDDDFDWDDFEDDEDL